MKLGLPDTSLIDAGFLLQGVVARETGRFSQLWVLGHAGPALWQAISRTGHDQEEDPVDQYSLGMATRYLDDHGVPDYQVLYPSGDTGLDLIGLGRELGWHHDSPLGTGIHPEYGSWFAYRTVIAVPEVFEIPPVEPTASPCESCSDKPCLAACPVGATGEVFNLDACGQHRLADTGDQSCALQCLARNACPVGNQYRYTNAQMEYHYGRSLQTIRLLDQDFP